MDHEKKFYLVSEEILPEAILKTAQVKELMAQGNMTNIMEAVNKVGLARSTFYKYRDGVFPFFDAESMRIVNLSLNLRHIPGVLSRVLNYVASVDGNILTINQNLPLQGTANVTLSVDIETLRIRIEEMLSGLVSIEGVLKAELIGRS